jgi:hypothetical protein
MERSGVEKALAAVIDAESEVGLRWLPGREMAPIAFRRLTTILRRRTKRELGAESRIHDLAKGLKAHYEPKDCFTPMSEWLHLAGIIVAEFDRVMSSAEESEHST